MMKTRKADDELVIIGRILGMLRPLPNTARTRIVEYVVNRVDAELPESKAEDEPEQLIMFPDRETLRAERAAEAAATS